MIRKEVRKYGIETVTYVSNKRQKAYENLMIYYKNEYNIKLNKIKPKKEKKP